MTLEDWVIKYYGYREAINPAQEACWAVAQKAERERIKHIVEHIGLQGNHDEWFNCCDMIRERIGE